MIEEQKDLFGDEIQKDLFGNVIIPEKENVYLNKSKSPQKDLSNETSVEYIVEIVCTDEKNQENIYNEFTTKGYTCRVLTL